MAGSYLEGSRLERGDYGITPFPLQIHFTANLAWAATQFKENQDYPVRLKEYLESLLQTDIELSLSVETPSEDIAPRNALNQKAPSAFERDYSEDSGLRLLVEIFKAELLSTKRIQRPFDGLRPMGQTNSPNPNEA